MTRRISCSCCHAGFGGTLADRAARGAQTGVSLGDVPNQDNPWNYSLGPTGTQHVLIANNTITQTACGVYLSAMHTWQNSNDVTVRGNRFLDIDTENFYGNGDTHAIGIQGGSRNVFEHNVIENPSFERAIGGGFVPDELR